MIPYPMLHHAHSASAAATLLLAVAVPVLGRPWRRRAPARVRNVAMLDRTATLALLATMLTGVVLANEGGWWPLPWVRVSAFVLVAALVLDVASIAWSSIPAGLRWTCRVAALLTALALMVVKPA